MRWNSRYAMTDRRMIQKGTSLHEQTSNNRISQAGGSNFFHNSTPLPPCFKSEDYCANAGRHNGMNSPALSYWIPLSASAKNVMQRNPCAPPFLTPPGTSCFYRLLPIFFAHQTSRMFLSSLWYNILHVELLTCPRIPFPRTPVVSQVHVESILSVDSLLTGSYLI